MIDTAELLDMPLEYAARVVAHIRPRDPDELYYWVLNFTGYQLPRKSVCPGHVAPLMAAWKIFDEEILDAVLFANRSGGKTVMMAVLNLADMLFKPGCEIATVGAILPQARKGYKYLQQMLQTPLFKDDVVETLMRETSLANGSSVEIVSSSASGLNCLSGETVIATCDGFEQIKDLVGKSLFFVPAFDVAAMRPTVDRVLRCWKVGENAPVFKVAFDKGMLFATKEHPLMLIDGSYRAVKDLKVGDRLMPLERSPRSMSEAVRLANVKNHRVVSIGFYGHADVYDMETEKYHNFVANGIVVHNSPHPMKARADEVELMDWDQVQQFFSMAVSAPDLGIKAQQCLSSTRKTLVGSMQKLLDRCEKDPSFSFQVLPWCLSGDSLIDTPSGERRLRDMKPGDWVYSYDLEAGRMTLKKVKHVGITGHNKKVKRVVLRYGKPPTRTRELIATTDHKVLLTREVWAQVQDLRPGVSLLALNRWYDRAGYGMLVFPARQEPELTVDGFPMQHGIASRLMRESRFVCENVHGPIEPGIVVHHIDGDVLNNDPSNLNLVPRNEHSRGHTGEAWENGRYVNAQERRADFYANNPEKLTERMRKINLNRSDRNHPSAVNHVVVKVEDAGEMDVWNMEVEDTHTFIAEGVVVRNCIFETIEACRVPICDECKAIIRSDGESFEEHCAGKAREADGFFPIEDAHRKFKLLDPDVWDAEWEGAKPSRGGLVVGKQWDDTVHWLPWVAYDPRLVSFGGVDFGYDAPFAAGVGQIDATKNLSMLEEYYGSELSLTNQIIPKLRELQELYNVRKWFCDATAPMQIRDLREAGIRAVACTRDRKTSYANIRAYLLGHQTGKPRLVMNQSMENFKKDILTCHFQKGQNDVVANEHSHGVDALAYLIWGIMYKLGDQGGGAEMPSSGGDGRGTVRKHRV